jgi:hypothetical protein
VHRSRIKGEFTNSFYYLCFQIPNEKTKYSELNGDRHSQNLSNLIFFLRASVFVSVLPKDTKYRHNFAEFIGSLYTVILL